MKIHITLILNFRTLKKIMTTFFFLGNFHSDAFNDKKTQKKKTCNIAAFKSYVIKLSRKLNPQKSMFTSSNCSVLYYKIDILNQCFSWNINNIEKKKIICIDFRLKILWEFWGLSKIPSISVSTYNFIHSELNMQKLCNK